ncbi:MetQ/NlpA family ABC transporter substrate-binding protein [Tissierella sp.]|uniref:MetQ/NlpA family ABC transporter substrate-binding protein n=1 Tax=Tissierella sp. TaxID=41274 RepID=UPI0028A8D291|nr:MetQ/NlpA family ABC transporter substrate-binding protein [Tissierella sp.]
MKRKFKLRGFMLIMLSLALILTSCGTEKEDSAPVKSEVNPGTETEEVKGTPVKVQIGCMSITEPIITFLSEGLKDKGFEIEAVVFDGNHLPATALRDGNVDGVILNHLVWLNTFNKENESDLVMPEPYMYYFRNALYSSKYDSTEAIPEGATIAVPGDPANLDRSLRILEELGFLKLGEKTKEFYSLVDVEENIKDVTILETEITATARSFKDVDAIICGANAMRDAGYDQTDFLFEDKSNEDYPLGLIVRSEDKNEDWVKAVLEYQRQEEFKEKFNNRYDFTYVLFE